MRVLAIVIGGLCCCLAFLSCKEEKLVHIEEAASTPVPVEKKVEQRQQVIKEDHPDYKPLMDAAQKLRTALIKKDINLFMEVLIPDEREWAKKELKNKKSMLYQSLTGDTFSGLMKKFENSQIYLQKYYNLPTVSIFYADPSWVRENKITFPIIYSEHNEEVINHKLYSFCLNRDGDKWFVSTLEFVWDQDDGEVEQHIQSDALATPLKKSPEK